MIHSEMKKLQVKKFKFKFLKSINFMISIKNPF